MISKLNRRLRVMATVVAVVWAWTAMAQADASVINKVAQRFSFTGYAQAGWEYHDQSDPNNEFSINKIILMSNFKVTDEVNAFAMFDFKGFTLHELWVNYRVKPWLQVKLGQFKTPFSIENPLSPASLEMITQTSLVTNHMICGASPTMMPAGAGRDIGLNVGGDAGTWLTYDLAVMNGAGRNKRDDNSWKDFVARLTLHPVQVLDVSASAVLGKGATKSLGEGMAAARNLPGHAGGVTLLIRKQGADQVDIHRVAAQHLRARQSLPGSGGEIRSVPGAEPHNIQRSHVQ